MGTNKKVQDAMTKLDADLDKIAARGALVESSEELDRNRSEFIAKNNRPPRRGLRGLLN